MFLISYGKTSRYMKTITFKTRDLIEKTLLCAPHGKEIGMIRDLAHYWDQGCIKGAIIETGNLINKREVLVPLECLKQVAGDWFTTIALDKLEPVADGATDGLWTKHRGLRVVSNWGKERGVLSDLQFTYPGGKIIAVEVSDGLLKDFIYGRLKVPYQEVATFTSSIIVIKEEWRQHDEKLSTV